MEKKHAVIDNAAEKREGQGIGKELELAALEDIRSKGLRVVPQCSFVEVYIRRHPEWADLVRTAESAKR